jgi:hypothetical protein
MPRLVCRHLEGVVDVKDRCRLVVDFTTALHKPVRKSDCIF